MTDEFTISPATRCGTVALIVADLGRSLQYYTQRIGLHVHRQAAGSAWLGAGGEDLLHLVGSSSTRVRAPARAHRPLPFRHSDTLAQQSGAHTCSISSLRRRPSTAPATTASVKRST